MMIRRKLEERELQQAIEFQDRRLMNLQLNDLKHHQFQRSLSLGVAVSSPTQMNQNVFSSNGNIEEFVSGGKLDSNTPYRNLYYFCYHESNYQYLILFLAM